MTVSTIAATPTGLALPGPDAGPAPALAVLQTWAESMRLATETVAPLVFTDFVPLHHWPQPAGVSRKEWPNPRLKHPREDDTAYRQRCEVACASAAATAVHAISLGIPPQVGLAGMYSIHGTVGMKTKLRYDYAISRGVKVWDVLLSEDKVTCAGINPVTDVEVEITITMEQAKKAGWTSNETYQKTPIDMLWSRAMGRVLDRCAGHLLNGIVSLEDLQDGPVVEDVQVVEHAPAKASAETLAAKRAARRPAAVESAPTEAAAELVDEDDIRDAALAADVDEQPEPPAPAPAGIDKRTWDAINREWVRLGVTGDGMIARRLRGVSNMVGRTVESGSELSAVEGDTVLDTLRSIAAEDVDRVADVLGEQAPEQPPVDEPDVQDPPAEPKGWEQ